MRNITRYFVWSFVFAFIPMICVGQSNQFTLMQEAPPDTPVVVYGSANEGNGARNTVVLEQNGDENPLGNPISETVSSNAENLETNNAPMPQVQKNKPIKSITEMLPENPKISARESPQEVNKQIQNTLYESGGRIYDIQSYPVSNVDYIGEKNINPTITTYPAY